ncbi:hypothetical protein FOCC_FOCC000428 [Frankliniella occidentalis]|nr:hypothetical protein FOCC_FOCC000428 [Frankliniella occidentalis]
MLTLNLIFITFFFVGHQNVKRQLFADAPPYQTLSTIDAFALEGVAPLQVLTPVEHPQCNPMETTLTPLIYQNLNRLEVHQNKSIQVDNDIFQEEIVLTSQSVEMVPGNSILDINSNEKTLDAPENNSLNETSFEEAVTFDNNAEETETEPNNNTEGTEAVRNNNTRSKRSSLPSLRTPPRKRQCCPSKRKAAIAKAAYNSGMAHTTLRGKEKRARSMREGCTEICRRKCQERISEAERQKLFKLYYGSQTKNSQWHILAKLAHQVGVAQRKVKSTSPYRKFSYKYYLTGEDGRPIPVCQTMFLDTFDISSTVVHTALNKNSPDKRGRHGTRKRTSPILIQSVKDHIKSFPVIESHYCREGSRRRYLQQNLSIARMHRLYVMLVGKGENTASVRQYRDIFNCSFNLGFYKPKKDQCSLCFKWNSLSPEQRLENEKLMKEHDEHQEAKTLVRAIRKEVKDYSRSEANSDGRVKVICFDLQKVFFCPKSEVGEFFYKRKISAYNFTVFDCTKKSATCFVWDQTIGGRGAVEISSCVYEFIKREVENGVKEFIIFSDSCWSQNKNKILFTMYYTACQKFQIKIIHRYLQKGHTQMECDSVHARIEHKTRNVDIFTPMQWYGHIRAAKVKKPSYAVFEVQQQHLVSYKVLAVDSFKWDKVPVSKIHEIVFDCTEKGKVYFKRKLSDPQTCFEILVKRPGHPYNWVTFKPPQAYAGPIPLKPQLVKDLEYFIKHGLIPADSLAFYKKVISPTFGVVCAEDGDAEDGDAPDESDIPEEVTENQEILDSLLNEDDEHHEDDPEGIAAHDEDTSDTASVSSDLLD